MRPGDGIIRQISEEFAEIWGFQSLPPGGEAAAFSSVDKTQGTHGCKRVSANGFLGGKENSRGGSAGAFILLMFACAGVSYTSKKQRIGASKRIGVGFPRQN